MATKSELLDLITVLRINLGWALEWVADPDPSEYETTEQYDYMYEAWLEALHEAQETYDKAKELEEKLGRLDKELV